MGRRHGLAGAAMLSLGNGVGVVILGAKPPLGGQETSELLFPEVRYLPLAALIFRDRAPRHL
jgi:hypothetical protein